MNTIIHETIDPDRPGVFTRQEEFAINGFMTSTIQNVTIESKVLATDYENYQLKYSCVQLDHFWMSETKLYYYISLKSRYFDSARTIVPLLEKLKTLKFNLNSFVYVNNTINCPN